MAESGHLAGSMALRLSENGLGRWNATSATSERTAATPLCVIVPLLAWVTASGMQSLKFLAFSLLFPCLTLPRPAYVVVTGNRNPLNKRIIRPALEGSIGPLGPLSFFPTLSRCSSPTPTPIPDFETGLARAWALTPLSLFRFRVTLFMVRARDIAWLQSQPCRTALPKPFSLGQNLFRS